MEYFIVLNVNESFNEFLKLLKKKPQLYPRAATYVSQTDIAKSADVRTRRTIYIVSFVNRRICCNWITYPGKK